ncbi:hypothetical protein [Limosilactobacillus reuteri]|uniref:Uncharacterized protein n=1 Tax=Limosilactobacillus reuteri TaxID=1598 RepID=A0A256VLC3_LIMRT|nr:hypothetical protein [Limosilactobacillus reuteri]OYS60494.1 hypothetical protein CBF88_02810 [Limosilactobacillus reuteri]OYS62118.1 hypothetical protein CBF91_02930 [Limosilactobacillus reuteri]OYS65333.1 hypothetical protein CBF89_02705 [Limosilactobacillus reuteri]OYS73520.1 hypothetical protein CBG01_02525 [Limosilactobacillus reuteri]OYS75649.1 hypothetical protein CBG08_03995 [Limosilactobacillus reuteri]
MLHKYRKTAIIKAEQVLGRAEAEHYQLALSWNPMRLDCGEPWFPENGGFGYLETKEGPMKVCKGDYIATGVDGEHWAIDKNIFERTYERCD